MIVETMTGRHVLMQRRCVISLHGGSIDSEGRPAKADDSRISQMWGNRDNPELFYESFWRVKPIRGGSDIDAYVQHGTWRPELWSGVNRRR